MLNVLRRSTPDWPGAAERHNQFLLAEANRRIEAGDHQSALATLEEIYERSSTFKGMPEAAGTVIDKMIEEAISHSDWRQARHFNNRLRRMYADHPIVQKWDNDLSSRAEQLLTKAEQAREQGDHALAMASAESATAIWPRTRNLRTRHRIYADRYQRLHVGVLDVPTPGFGDPVLSTRGGSPVQPIADTHVFPD